jgi:hypothetical protein
VRLHTHAHTHTHARTHARMHARNITHMGACATHVGARGREGLPVHAVWCSEVAMRWAAPDLLLIPIALAPWHRHHGVSGRDWPFVQKRVEFATSFRWVFACSVLEVLAQPPRPPRTPPPPRRRPPPPSSSSSSTTTTTRTHRHQQQPQQKQSGLQQQHQRTRCSPCNHRHHHPFTHITHDRTHDLQAQRRRVQRRGDRAGRRPTQAGLAQGADAHPVTQ